ncbi:MAG: DUF2304 domain-containing protein [Lachnospiraceae bacterium]|nr:DUF2304 domain-containing protein [Lachnospiraceae bacterium]
MMSFKLQVILVVILLAALAVIVAMLKKRTLDLKYVLVWIFCLVVLLIFSIFPGTMTKLARFIGIYSPVNMIFFLGFLLAVTIIFTLTVSLSRTTGKVRKLAQMMALENDTWKKENEEAETGAGVYAEHEQAHEELHLQ